MKCDAFGGLARDVLSVQPPAMADRLNTAPLKSLGEPEDDALIRSLSGRLFIGATECRTGRRTVLSRFENRHQLLRCVLASSAIPSSAHPFDLLRDARWRPPTYPESSGVIIPPSCEHRVRADDEGCPSATADPASRLEENDRLPYSPHGEPFVDGGLTAAVPFVPDDSLLHLTVSPVSGPRGRLVNKQALGGPREHLHVCPEDTSLRLPFVAPELAGMRCFLSLQNLQALRSTMGASTKAMRRWYERGQADAELQLDSREAQQWLRACESRG